MDGRELEALHEELTEADLGTFNRRIRGLLDAGRMTDSEADELLSSLHGSEHPDGLSTRIEEAKREAEEERGRSGPVVDRGSTTSTRDRGGIRTHDLGTVSRRPLSHGEGPPWTET